MAKVWLMDHEQLEDFILVWLGSTPPHFNIYLWNNNRYEKMLEAQSTESAEMK